MCKNREPMLLTYQVCGFTDENLIMEVVFAEPVSEKHLH